MILKRSSRHKAPRGPILESLGSASVSKAECLGWARSLKPKGSARLGLEKNVSTTSLLLILQRFDHYEYKNDAIHALIES